VGDARGGLGALLGLFGGTLGRLGGARILPCPCGVVAAGFEAMLRVVGAGFCGGCAVAGIAGPLAGAFGTFTSLL
jgi:hypothetical protein